MFCSVCKLVWGLIVIEKLFVAEFNDFTGRIWVNSSVFDIIRHSSSNYFESFYQTWCSVFKSLRRLVEEIRLVDKGALVSTNFSAFSETKRIN